MGALCLQVEKLGQDAIFQKGHPGGHHNLAQFAKLIFKSKDWLNKENISYISKIKVEVFLKLLMNQVRCELSHP